MHFYILLGAAASDITLQEVKVKTLLPSILLTQKPKGTVVFKEQKGLMLAKNWEQRARPYGGTQPLACHRPC